MLGSVYTLVDGRPECKPAGGVGVGAHKGRYELLAASTEAAQTDRVPEWRVADRAPLGCDRDGLPAVGPGQRFLKEEVLPRVGGGDVA